MIHCDVWPDSSSSNKNSSGSAPGESAEAAAAATASRLRAAEDIISRVLLPASTMVPSNLGLSSEVWCLLSLFPYHTRFRFYGELKVRFFCGDDGVDGHIMMYMDAAQL